MQAILKTLALALVNLYIVYLAFSGTTTQDDSLVYGIG